MAITLYCDEHDVTHRIIGEQDWTWEYYKACDVGMRERIPDTKIAVHPAYWFPTCVACVGRKDR